MKLFNPSPAIGSGIKLATNTTFLIHLAVNNVLTCTSIIVPPKIAIKFLHKLYILTFDDNRREPWSSGYGRRLML